MLVKVVVKSGLVIRKRVDDDIGTVSVGVTVVKRVSVEVDVIVVRVVESSDEAANGGEGAGGTEDDGEVGSDGIGATVTVVAPV